MNPGTTNKKLLGTNKTKPDENEIMIDENETKCVQPHFADLACDVFDFVHIKQVLVREWGTIMVWTSAVWFWH